MQKVTIMALEGTEFPAGRKTRVILGENGAINGEHFCQGYVVIHPNGCIPSHAHSAAESYTVLRGSGEMTVDGETRPIEAGELVYMPPDKPHALVNTGEGELHMMFVYAPKMIVEHWAQEQSGELRDAREPKG